jgi:nucleoside-diphosphate-sugar epimerase
MATLITGGTGLIGARLAAGLLERGERVVLLDLAIAEWRIAPLRSHGDRLTVVRGDVQSLAELLDALETHRVTALVHLAYVLGGESNTRPELATRVNILGTANALEAARLAGVGRVLLASSIAVYGADGQYRPGELPLHEEAAQHVAAGVSVYEVGVLAHIEAARARGATVVR